MIYTLKIALLILVAGKLSAVSVVVKHVQLLIMHQKLYKFFWELVEFCCLIP